MPMIPRFLLQKPTSPASPLTAPGPMKVSAHGDEDDVGGDIREKKVLFN